MRTFDAGQLTVVVEADRSSLGAAAARRAAGVITTLQQRKESVRIVFAAAPSQNEMLAELIATPGIDWSRVEALHMDEYLGLAPGSAELFGSYLMDHIFSKVRVGALHLLNGQASDPEKECERYAALVQQQPIDLVCLGIGENGHLAFNDPPVADFHDPRVVKVVELDEACRQQQVHDGCFPSLAHVPGHALTLTVPALMRGVCLNAVVPGSAKAEAVRQTIEGPIALSCPASILRTHPNAALFLDADSASRLQRLVDPQGGFLR
jgi:glucosamine-6-phosphate deaminase